MQVSLLFPIIMAALILLLVAFALFGVAIKNLFVKKTTPLNAKRRIVFNPSADGSHIATQKTTAVPFIEPTQVSVVPAHILPSRRLLMAATTNTPELKELEVEEAQMAKRAREPMVLPPR